MICFLMRMDKRLRVQLFFLALIVVNERFAEGDSSTMPASTTKSCHKCLGKKCDDPTKVETEANCNFPCTTNTIGNLNYRGCANNIPEVDCIVSLFPDSPCFNPKDFAKMEEVKKCAKDRKSGISVFSSEKYDQVCLCHEDLCNSKNLPPVGTGGGGGGSGSGGSGTTEASGGSTTANSTSVRIHTRPFIPFSLAIETIVVAAGLKMNV